MTKTKKLNWEKEVIELYEKVATMQITPNQARVAFMKLLKKQKQEIVEELEGKIDMAFSCNYMPQTYLEIVEIFKEFKKAHLKEKK